MLTQTFKTDDGFIKFKDVISAERYEFTELELDSFWDKATNWISIVEIRVNEKFKNKGVKLLKQFINTILNDTGIILNAVPLDADILFIDLQKWYIKHGFKQISEDNLSLYLIKNANT